MPEENKNEQQSNNQATAEPQQGQVSTYASNPSDATQQPPSAEAAPVVGSQMNKPKKTKLPLFIGIILAVILLSLGVVFGYVIPNQPENVLKAAIANSASETKAKFDGKYSIEFLDESAPVKAMNVEMTGQTDVENKASEVSMKFTATGVSVPFDLRHVENSLYFKLGDISTIKSLAQAAAPEYSGMIDEVNKLIADQWIEVDETLLKQAELDCVINNLYATPTEEDFNKLLSTYDEYPFGTIKNTTTEDLNGRSAYKFEIDIDDNKASEYLKNIDELSTVKKLKECPGQDQETKELYDELADDDTTPVTIWVDKSSKTISKIMLKSTAQDEEQDKMRGEMELSITYGEANVQKPENAKPAVELLAELQAALLGGYGTLGANSDEAVPATTAPSGIFDSLLQPQN